MQELSVIQNVAVAALPVLFAITLHEVAHGWAAKRLGDSTAMMLGRLTLNTIKHIDPLGTVVLPLLMLLSGGFLFGWAKPVPVTVENLKNPKRDMAYVALAGPLANLIMAFLWAGIMKLGMVLMTTVSAIGGPLYHMGRYGIWINVVLCVLNLLPLPPLDGGRVLVSVLPNELSWKVSRLEPYGVPILLGLIIIEGVAHIPTLSAVLGPPIQGLLVLLGAIFGI